MSPLRGPEKQSCPQHTSIVLLANKAKARRSRMVSREVGDKNLQGGALSPCTCSSETTFLLGRSSMASACPVGSRSTPSHLHLDPLTVLRCPATALRKTKTQLGRALALGLGAVPSSVQQVPSDRGPWWPVCSTTGCICASRVTRFRKLGASWESGAKPKASWSRILTPFF